MPDIEVSPTAYNFGYVELGSSATIIVNISNVGGADLTVSNVDFQEGSCADFSINSTTSSTLPVTVAPNGTLDVEIAYAPSVAELCLGTLEIVSDDSDEAEILVDLQGEGVLTPTPPDEQIQNILDFFDESVANGTLEGTGFTPGMVERRLNRMRHLLERARLQTEEGEIQSAYCTLVVARLRCDDKLFPLPDFVKGDAWEELAQMITDLMASLGCQ